MTSTATNRPVPPDDLDGEALLEWQRACDELAAAGTLDKTDRAILTQYVELWAINRSAAAHVSKFGSVVKWPNGMPGQSPQYKVAMETAKQIRGLLNDLGLTPVSRGKTTSEPDDDLKF